MPALKDMHKRSIMKSITWRISGIIVLGITSWLITHSWGKTALITLIFHGIHVILYYFHERIWEGITWGRIKHPLSDLSVSKDIRPVDMEIIRTKLNELGYLK
jgi:uncharacterized membrane protein